MYPLILLNRQMGLICQRYLMVLTVVTKYYILIRKPFSHGTYKKN